MYTMNGKALLQILTCIEMTSEQFSALPNVAPNIVFFCLPCLCKLPGALMAFDNTSEVCSSVEQKIESIELKSSDR